MADYASLIRPTNLTKDEVPIDKTHLVMYTLQLKKRTVMNFRSSLVSAALIVVGCVSLCAGAEAQGAPGTQSVSSDGTGLVVVGAILLERSNPVYPDLPCGGGTLIGMGQVTAGKYLESRGQQGIYKAFGALKNYEPIALKPGQWYIGSARCRTSRTTFRGPYAKFQVKAGEVVDVGTLKLEYSSVNVFLSKGKISASILPTDQERLAEIRKQTPAVMKKMVTRPMVLEGPPEREVILRRGF